MTSEDVDRIYSVHPLKGFEESPSQDLLLDLAAVLGFDSEDEESSMHFLELIQEDEGEALASGLTLDEAVELHYALDDIGLCTAVMERCECCQGRGGWSGHNIVQGIAVEQEADCGECEGRGVVYLPEGE